MSHSRHQLEFRDQGFTIWRNFFSDEEMDRTLEEIQRAEPLKTGPSGLNRGGLTFYSNIFYRSPYLRSFISQKKVVDFLREIIGPDFWVRWDQAVAKGPGGEEFPWHQDNGYNRLKVEHFQFWIALTEMTQENGTLWLQPGSHREGVLPHHWDRNHLVCAGNPENAVSIEADKGDIVLFSSMMLHRTSPNVSKGSRWAYVVEYISLDHFDPYIDPPYFVVARGGEPCPEFVRVLRGSLQPKNLVRYLGAKLKRGIRRKVRSPLAKISTRILHRRDGDNVRQPLRRP